MPKSDDSAEIETAKVCSECIVIACAMYNVHVA